MYLNLRATIETHKCSNYTQVMLRLSMHEGGITPHREVTPIQHPGTSWAALCVKPKKTLPVLSEVMQKGKEKTKKK